MARSDLEGSDREHSDGGLCREREQPPPDGPAVQPVRGAGRRTRLPGLVDLGPDAATRLLSGPGRAARRGDAVRGLLGRAGAAPPGPGDRARPRRGAGAAPGRGGDHARRRRGGRRPRAGGQPAGGDPPAQRQGRAARAARRARALPGALGGGGRTGRSGWIAGGVRLPGRAEAHPAPGQRRRPPAARPGRTGRLEGRAGPLRLPRAGAGRGVPRRTRVQRRDHQPRRPPPAGRHHRQAQDPGSGLRGDRSRLPGAAA